MARRVEKFRTITADPPWQQLLGGTWTGKADKARPQRQYSLLTLDSIKAMRVPSAKQAHLYMWCIAQHIDWGYEVARAWGFEPVITWTWRKPGVGCGRFMANTEHIVVARKGSRHGNPFGFGGRHSPATKGTCFDWPRGGHSEKPAEFYRLVESISPGPRLEMFARSPCVGWSVWGDEVKSDCMIHVRTEEDRDG